MFLLPLAVEGEPLLQLHGLAKEERRARFLNGWVKTLPNNWIPLNQARFTASSAEWESKDNIDAGVSNGAFYLATGGETRMSRELKSIVNVPGGTLEPAKPPRDLAPDLTQE